MALARAGGGAASRSSARPSTSATQLRAAILRVRRIRAGPAGARASRRTPAPTSSSSSTTCRRRATTRRREPRRDRRSAGSTLRSAPRTRTTIAHNKFLVLLRDGRPLQVWTGSTNITEGGIFGHANVGHRDQRPGASRSATSTTGRRSTTDPERKTLRAFNDPTAAFPAGRPRRSTRPRSSARAPTLDAARVVLPARELGEERASSSPPRSGSRTRSRRSSTDKRDYLRYLLLDLETGNVEAVRRDPERRRRRRLQGQGRLAQVDREAA